MSVDGLESVGKRRAFNWLGLVAFTLLMLAASVSHGAVFGDWSGYIAAMGGALLAVVVTGVAYALGLRRLETILALVIAYLLGGALALPNLASAKVFPSLQMVQTLVLGAVTSWRDLLTLAPPANAYAGITVVPYLSAMVCAGLGASIVLRHQRGQLWALLPAGLMFALGALFGGFEAPYGRDSALVGVLVALAWAAWAVNKRHGRGQRGLIALGAGRLRRRARLGTLLMLACAMAAGAVLGPQVTGANNREVLRSYVTPPLNIAEYQAPLTRLHYWVDTQKDTTLFTVSGLQNGERIRVATMDAYDGNVMRVGTSDNGEGFKRVGAQVDTRVLPKGAKTHNLTFTMVDYQGNWLPGGGQVRSFTPRKGQGLTQDLFYSSNLGALLSTRTLVKGDSYSVNVVTVPTYSDAQLSKRRFGKVANGTDTNVPAVVATRLREFVGNANSPLARVRAMATKYHDEGYYSDGSDSMARPGHRTARIDELLEPNYYMVGDDEQYAVAMALMARQAGYPARVVLGFYPEHYSKGTLEVKGTMAHAWVEVNFDGDWVAFDPTPPRDKKLVNPKPQPKPKPRPQVLQAPPPPQEQADLTPDVSDDRDTKKKHGFDWAHYLLLVGQGLGVAALVSSPFALILALKAVRGRRRRNRDELGSALGAWAELEDWMRDYGIKLPTNATRTQMARYLDIALADYDAAAAQAAQAKRAKQQAKRNAQALGGQVDLAPKLRGAEAIAAANAAGSAAVGAGSGGDGVANDGAGGLAGAAQFAGGQAAGGAGGAQFAGGQAAGGAGGAGGAVAAPLYVPVKGRQKRRRHPIKALKAKWARARERSQRLAQARIDALEPVFGSNFPPGSVRNFALSVNAVAFGQSGQGSLTTADGVQNPVKLPDPQGVWSESGYEAPQANRKQRKGRFGDKQKSKKRSNNANLELTEQQLSADSQEPLWLEMQNLKQHLGASRRRTRRWLAAVSPVSLGMRVPQWLQTMRANFRRKK
ncbi:hypothetical protein HMPREF0045_01035 [Actinomyces graevenitzii C83]|uniref:Transglutaminase-like domain-containing protein n=1 Tax=Actinomyces graevenitzii C83 TaxID=435830 RepID=G9PFL1_9ACTO|nr:transglutaminase domain-containing protein [Actinomyces graevenitzii]EHM88196.1 hypothetical protein HMPREF0045_01035 [Actinomyces graevenitzii C83]